MLMSAVFAQSDCNESNWEDYYNSDGKDMSDCDLAKADLTGADLRGADLEGAILVGAILTDASLRGAALTQATLGGADLTGADLTDADLERADLRRMKLIDADLTDANLTGADLERADLTNADLERADLRGADLTDASLRGADLTDATLGGADLRGADLTGAQLNGVKSGFNIGRPLSLPDGWSLVDGKFELIKEPIVYQSDKDPLVLMGDAQAIIKDINSVFSEPMTAKEAFERVEGSGTIFLNKMRIELYETLKISDLANFNIIGNGATLVAKIDMPIMNSIYNILYNEYSIKEE